VMLLTKFGNALGGSVINNGGVRNWNDEKLKFGEVFKKGKAIASINRRLDCDVIRRYRVSSDRFS
jgi:hypothetical protein